ncbi:MAG: response regulator, partial [Acidobacteria bacterium]|nr:response regulator [Acidobacteriota bacterium]
QFTRHYADPANPAALSSNEVQTLHVDATGRLWVGTRSGLNLVDPASGAVTRFEHRATDSRTIPAGMVTAMADAGDGGLWVSTEGGLGLLEVTSGASGRFTRFAHDRLDATSLADNRVRALIVDRRGRLWVGTETRGLDRYDPRTGHFTHFPPGSGISHASVNALLEDADGRIWVGGWGGGVTRVVDDAGSGRVSFIAYRHDPANPSTVGADDVNTLAQDRSGVVWVGTHGVGLSWFKPSGRISLTQYRHSPADGGTLGDDRVHALLVDRSGTTWIGTWGGLNVLRPGSARFERLPASYLSDARVTSLAEAPDGSIWAGTLDGGANRIDRATGRVEYVRQGEAFSGRGLSSDRVTAITADADGAIWIGTLNAGLNRYDPVSGAFTRFRFNGGSAASLSSDRVQRIVADAAGRVWVATSEGLDVIDRATAAVRRVGAIAGAPESLRGAINAIHQYPDGLVWVGTSTGGLVRFEVAPDGAISSFHAFDRDQGMSSEVVLGILNDADGHLWLATSEGLNRFDPRTSAVLAFDETDGLRSEEFYSFAVRKTGAHEILLGGPRGLVTFRPQEVRQNPYAPPVALTGFTILNRPVPIGGDSPLQQHISETSAITLSHQATVFSFEFAAFNYGASDRVRYAYRLEGFDPEWNLTDASRRSATYTNLNPGTYTFRVRAANRDDVWTEQPLGLTVVIRSPYWETWWFRLLVGAGVLALLFAGVRRRLAVIERQRRQLEQLVETRTAELRDQTMKSADARAAAERANADKSKFLANITHEIRTPLNAVIGLSDALGGTRLNPQQKEYARALRSAGEALNEIIADILDVSKIEADRFELARGAFEIRRLIEEAADVARVSALNKGLALEVDVAADVPAVVLGDHRALRRVLLNLLGNAVKFTDVGAVSLHVANGGDFSSLVFIVTDTGIGIQPSEQQRIFESFVQADASISSKYGGTGLGLAISRRLVELMGGRLWLESVPGRGSTFSFSVPLPMVAPSLAPPRDAVLQSPAAIQPLRLLVVDDAEQNRMVMRAYFQDTPHSVTMAESGEAALEKFAAAKYDLVLMDVQMPGMDGYATTRAMRKWEHDSRRERTPIVAVTAN